MLNKYLSKGGCAPRKFLGKAEPSPYLIKAGPAQLK